MLNETVKVQELVGRPVLTVLHDMYSVITGPKTFFERQVGTAEESMARTLGVLFVSTLLLAAIFYGAVSATYPVRQPAVLFVGAVLISMLWALFYSIVFGVTARVCGSKAPRQSTISVMAYAFSLMPFISLLMLPLTTTRVAAMAEDRTLFQSIYLAAFRSRLHDLPLAELSNLLGFLLYGYFGYMLFVGLRATSTGGRVRAVAAVVLTMGGVLVVQNWLGLPVEHALVQAALRQ